MRHYLLQALLGAALIPATAFAQEATATFMDADGAEVGTADLTATGAGLFIDVEVGGLPPSAWVAVHIHETGTCDHATDHESAGGHFNPTGAEHGYFAQGGPHAGDMPNIWSDAEGVARAQVVNPALTLGEDETTALGKALMIHAGADDYRSQPSGDAGDRLACAVIEARGPATP